jgi:multisubunit Na+/H+ antiporter MnhF subunit
VNGWNATAAALIAGGLGPCVWGVATGPLRRRVVALNLSGALACPALLLLSQGYGRPAYLDLALVLALLGPVGTMVFARLLAGDLAGDRPRARAVTWIAAGIGAAVVVAVCAAADPGRTTVKILVVGALVIAGNLLASRALSQGFQEATEPAESPAGAEGGPRG